MKSVEATVPEIDRPIDGEAGEIDEVDRKHPRDRSADDLRRDTGTITQRDQRDELPTCTRRRRGLEILIRIDRPRQTETYQHDRFEKLRHQHHPFRFEDYRPVCAITKRVGILRTLGDLYDRSIIFEQFLRLATT